MTSAARGWSNHPSGDEISEAIVWCVEWRESGDRATPICDDHLFAGLHAIDVLAETILEVANPDLRPRSSYVHTLSAAISTAQSTGRFGKHIAANKHYNIRTCVGASTAKRAAHNPTLSRERHPSEIGTDVLGQMLGNARHNL